MPLNTVDIPDVEIFAVGTHNGQAYTAADLNDMVIAFQALRNGGDGGYSPPIKLDHTENQPSLGDIPQDGGPAFGWLDNLRRVGDKLVADFKRVPEKLKELIDAGAYRGRSAEVWWDLEVDGKKYRRVLKAVALLGVAMPAVRSLADITRLYAGQSAFAYDQEKGAGVHIVLGYAEGPSAEDMTGLMGMMERMMSRMRGMMPKGDMPKGDKMAEEDPAQAVHKEVKMPEDTITVQQFADLQAKYEARFVELTAKVETLTQGNVALTAENATLRTHELARWASDTVRGWIGDIEGNRQRLITFAEKLGRDSVELRAYIDREDANAKAVKIIGEIGSGGQGHATVTSEMEAAIAKHTAAGKSRIEAIKLVANEQPKVYAEYAAAVRAGTTNGN